MFENCRVLQGSITREGWENQSCTDSRWKDGLLPDREHRAGYLRVDSPGYLQPVYSARLGKKIIIKPKKSQ